MSNFKSPLRVVQVNLKAGELDPLLRMRTDSDALATGLRRLRNMLLLSTGGATRRPGTTFRARLPQRCRLIEFEYDANEKYVMAFYDNGLRIYTKTGTLVQTFGAQFCPWQLDNDFWEMQHVQKGDVMIVAHNTFPMTVIRRLDLDNFEIRYLRFTSDTGTRVINQPYTRYFPADYALACSSISIGTGRTLTCNYPIFSASWIGERVRIFNREVEITAIQDARHATVTVRQKIQTDLDIAPFRYTQGSAVIEVTHAQHGFESGASVTIAGATGNFDVSGNDINGSRTITVIDDDHYSVVAGATADESADGGGTAVKISTTGFTTSWQEQVWSNRRGWPGAVCLHEDRLWLGGSRINPTFLAASAVGDYYDFNLRDGLDDESVQGTIATLARIQYLVSAKVLQIFTETSEAIAETANGVPITPSNLKVVTQTYYGTYKYGMPRIFDGATLFIQRNAKNIRELMYDFNTDTHVSSPISVLASHLISTPHDLATLKGTSTRPEQYAFIVNGNANVPIFHSIRSEKMAGFTCMTIGGVAETIVDSCCSMGNDVFFSVRRKGIYYLERLELDPLASGSPATTDPAVWLDGAAILKPVGVQTRLTGLQRYAGDEVSIMAADGLFVGRLTIDNAGQVDLPTPLEGPFVVGYDYGVEIITNPPDMQMNDGPMTGQIRRLASSNIHFHASVSASVNGAEVLGFEVGHDPSVGRPAFTGKRLVRHLGYSRDPVTVITQQDPGPLTILGIVQEVSL